MCRMEPIFCGGFGHTYSHVRNTIGYPKIDICQIITIILLMITILIFGSSPLVVAVEQCRKNYIFEDAIR